MTVAPLVMILASHASLTMSDCRDDTLRGEGRMGPGTRSERGFPDCIRALLGWSWHGPTSLLVSTATYVALLSLSLLLSDVSEAIVRCITVLLAH